MTERSVGFRTPPDDTEVVHEMLAGLWGELPDLPAAAERLLETDRRQRDAVPDVRPGHRGMSDTEA